VLEESIAIYSDQSEQRDIARRLEESQQQYRNIVESSLDGIVVVQNGRLVYVNPAATSIFGYGTAEEMRMVNFTDTVAPASRPFLFFGHEGRASGEDILRNYEMRGLTKQGKMIDLEANARVIQWNEELAVQASFRDITERKMLEREQALWLWEQETLSDIDRKLVGVVDLTRILDAILVQTLNLSRAHWAGIIMVDETNTQAQWKAAKGNTQPVVDDFFPINKELAEIFRSRDPLVLQESGANSRFPISSFPKLMEERVVSSAWFPLVVDKKQKGVLVVGFRHYHDFAGRELRLLVSLAEKNSIALANAALYENLVQREKELEILAGARVQAQEEERRRIAREIHDGLGQLLTAIKFNLEILEDTIATGGDEHKRIDDMKNMLDSVMKEAREISYNLMPSVLDDFGLAPALQLLCEQFSQRRNIKVTFEAHGLSQRLFPELEICLYRIVQEGLNNAAKHANPTYVSVELVRHGKGVGLTIEDNGAGMAQILRFIRATEKGGMGLVGMKERVASFNGTLDIESTPGHGTSISIEIPLLPVPTTVEERDRG
jgi:PAS domain S-box-containing protein